MLKENNIDINEESNITFSDSSWNDCKDTVQSTGGYLTLCQGGAVDFVSHLPIPVDMSSGEAKYVAAAIACMRGSRLRMLRYNFDNLSKKSYDNNITNYKSAHVMIDNEAAIAMTSCNKDTTGNRHVTRRYHYVQQGANLKERVFHFISTKYQLAGPLTMEGRKVKFKDLWDKYMIDMDNLHLS